jgi:hypothetical protein
LVGELIIILRAAPVCDVVADVQEGERSVSQIVLIGRAVDETDGHGRSVLTNKFGDFICVAVFRSWTQVGNGHYIAAFQRTIQEAAVRGIGTKGLAVEKAGADGEVAESVSVGGSSFCGHAVRRSLHRTTKKAGMSKTKSA